MPWLRKTFFLSYIFVAGSWGLYFPQTTYSESIYIGQAAGTPVLQIHSMQERALEQPYFCLSWWTLQRSVTHTSWFYIDAVTGVIHMNKTLDWSDFDSIREFKKVCFSLLRNFIQEFKEAAKQEYKPNYSILRFYIYIMFQCLNVCSAKSCLGSKILEKLILQVCYNVVLFCISFSQQLVATSKEVDLESGSGSHV